ncbi:NACHT, LRR and PYD domains-containing protein 12 [Pholidichthys leucotaenia]
MYLSSSVISTMDKAAVLAYMLSRSKFEPSLLGGELPVSVINNNRYIPPITFPNRVTDDELASWDHVIGIALTGEFRNVTLEGPEGCGKTTALEKLIVDWAKGERLQNFSYVFHFSFREVHSHENELSLEALIQHHHPHVPPMFMPQVVHKPEHVLFVFDGLDEYKHSLDPSVYTLCSDPSQPMSMPSLVASLLHGSLLKGAAIVVATRQTENLNFLNGVYVGLMGFLKPQREAYFKSFFSDSAAASRALAHMENTVGFYDFATAPRFSCTVCSMYKYLMDSGAKLPETLTQLFVDILVHQIQKLSLNQAGNRELVLALSKIAFQCLTDKHFSCTKDEINSSGLQRFLDSLGVFLRVEGEWELGTCVFAFYSKMMQEFILAVSFFLDKSAYVSVEKMLEKCKDSTEFLHHFLSGLSEPTQCRPLETLLGKFDSCQQSDFKHWFKSSLEETLGGWRKEEHFRFLHMLHQAQNESLVRETITPSTKIGLNYSDLSLQDSVALHYVVMCRGTIDPLGLYKIENLTDEKAEVLAPVMALLQKINLSCYSISTSAIALLVSALMKGCTTELVLSHIEDENFKILLAGLKDCKLQKLSVPGCKLTGASCGDLVPLLTSETSQLSVLELRYNPIGDECLAKLCRALHSPHCKLSELWFNNCELTATSMEALSAVLCSGQSQLRHVELASNRIGDSGVQALCKGLQHPLCKLEHLSLFDTELTSACCPYLKEALMSEHFTLSELDLSLNELGEGVLLLCHAFRQPGCPIKTLRLVRCELNEEVFKELGSLLKNETCQLKSLSVGLNNVGDKGVKPLWEAVAHPHCLLENLDVEMTRLTDACVEDLCAALRASKTLKTLEMRNNTLTDVSVPAIVEAIQSSDSMEEMCLRYNEFSEDVFEILDECDKITY